VRAAIIGLATHLQNQQRFWFEIIVSRSPAARTAGAQVTGVRRGPPASVAPPSVALPSTGRSVAMPSTPLMVSY